MRTFSPDISQTTWRDFAARPDYPMVGTYPGAGTYRSGIWRPEENSCMNDNVAYFNAPSRWAQIRRIRRLAGEPDYTFDAFLLEDRRPAYPVGTRSGIGGFVPLRAVGASRGHYGAVGPLSGEVLCSERTDVGKKSYL